VKREKSGNGYVFTYRVFTYRVFAFHVFAFHVFTFHVSRFTFSRLHVFTFHLPLSATDYPPIQPDAGLRAGRDRKTARTSIGSGGK
jgi:hypothetical protein